MVISCGKVVSELVSYIEECHPEVLFMLRSIDGKTLGLPNIVILEMRSDLERGIDYVGLSMWVTSKITDYRMDQMDRFVMSGHAVTISDDYDGLLSVLMRYLSLYHPGDHDPDSRQLEVIKGMNRRGVVGEFERRERTPLTSMDYDLFQDVVGFVMEKYKCAAIMPTFGSESGPDITIFSSKVLHKGLAIWLSKSHRCYDLHSLSYDPFNCLLNTAKRSYITIASRDYQDITDMITLFMISEFECGERVPAFCEEDCE